MVFGFNVKEKKEFTLLTEEDIRSRLYGSAVGISADIFDKVSRNKKNCDRKAPLPLKGSSDEMFKIHNELTSLRLELERAKRRLEKIKGVSVKRLQIIFIYIIIGFAVLFSLVFVFRNVFSPRPKTESADIAVSASKTRYTVQVAVSERLADAEKFKANLEDKGYKPFIRKSSFASGKDRFIIYAGRFDDRKSASALADNLRSKENIKDSFVINMPKEVK